jgi:hypothetical protein
MLHPAAFDHQQNGQRNRGPRLKRPEDSYVDVGMLRDQEDHFKWLSTIPNTQALAGITYNYDSDRLH